MTQTHTLYNIIFENRTTNQIYNVRSVILILQVGFDIQITLQKHARNIMIPEAHMIT